MTTGAPKTAVTELMLTSVGAKAVRAMRSQNRQERAAAEETGRDHQKRLCGLKKGLHQVRHGDADEGDRAGKGRDAGGEHTGK